MELFMSEKEIWEKVLDLAKERISKISFDTFVKDTQLYSLQNDKAIVLVSESFNANWLNQKYSEIMQSIIYDVIGYEVKPHFITEVKVGQNFTKLPSNAPWQWKIGIAGLYYDTLRCIFIFNLS